MKAHKKTFWNISESEAKVKVANPGRQVKIKTLISKLKDKVKVKVIHKSDIIILKQRPAV